MKGSSAPRARRSVILGLTPSLGQLSTIMVRAEEACGGPAKSCVFIA